MSAMLKPDAASFNPIPSDTWLAQRQEPVIEPDLPIIDPHHHLWHRPNWRYEAEFARWCSAISELATCPNVSVKLGGLGMASCGFALHECDRPSGSEELAQLWRPWIEHCIAAFGPERSMFESNFPVDRASCSYRVLWNAFKRLAAGYPASEKHDLFAGSAARIYRLQSPGAQFHG